MLWLILIMSLGFLLGSWLLKRGMRQKNMAVGTVETPGYTENKISSDFVFVTFRPKNQLPVTVEYYYNKSIYNTPQDFARLNKTVNVKYDPANASNFTIYEESKGDYSKYIAPAIIGILIGSLAASNTEGTNYEKIENFLIGFAVTTIATALVIKLSGFFSFLNIFTKRDE